MSPEGKNEEKGPNFNLIVRILNSDLDGNKSLYLGLRKIKGISEALANAICHLSGFGRDKLVGSMTKEELAVVENIVKDPLASGIPVWMLNRRKDIETGEDIHVVSTGLKLTVEEDKKILQKIKSYIGLRHSWKLPVRGQRTKSNFRKNKGKAVATKKTTLKH